jgi:anti-sigma regulatory factor (Ser/Thr protein kinase)/predicted GIY-YIG superfamily endonuclease
MDHIPGTIYLIHLNRPYKHAKHYLGWAADLDARLAQHQNGTGARLLQVARNNGISWQLARTWQGDRHRERQLKNQGGRSRMCPVCKHTTPKGTAMTSNPATPRRQPEHQDTGALRSQLPADLTSARRARSAVRTALAAWGMTDKSGDAELLASELVANAAQHARGPIGLALTRHQEPGGQAAITCEVTDTSPAPPQARQAGPGDEHGRGLAIVTALADTSGVRAEPPGKTTWFTLALGDRIDRTARQPEPEPELEAGA